MTRGLRNIIFLEKGGRTLIIYSGEKKIEGEFDNSLQTHYKKNLIVRSILEGAGQEIMVSAAAEGI